MFGPGQRLRSALGRVGMVVNVALPEVLGLGVDVRLVIMFESWVIVLVGMRGRQVLPLAAVPQVMHHVSVLMGMDNGIMGVFHGHPSLPCSAFGYLLPPGTVPGTLPAQPRPGVKPITRQNQAGAYKCR